MLGDRDACEVCSVLKGMIRGEEGIMGISENLEARLAAEQIGELADEEAKRTGRRFWMELAKIVSAHVPIMVWREGKNQVHPMADKQAKLFGSERLPFGEFVGQRVDDVPMDRLQWYADQTFTDDLRRYLESDRVKTEVR